MIILCDLCANQVSLSSGPSKPRGGGRSFVAWGDDPPAKMEEPPTPSVDRVIQCPDSILFLQ